MNEATPVPCKCGAQVEVVRLGIMYLARCSSAMCRHMVTCSTRIGAIEKWNRSIRTIEAVR